MKATFSPDRRKAFLELLGFSGEALLAKTNELLQQQAQHQHSHDVQEATATLDDSETNGVSSEDVAALDGLASQVNNALNLNNNNNTNTGSDQFEAIARAMSPVQLSFANQVESVAGELLLLGHYEQAVEVCMRESRYADAILIAHFFDQALLMRVQQRYLAASHGPFATFLERFLNRDWSRMIATCPLGDWRDALAALLTHTSAHEFVTLCDALGSRLESADELLNACICYILSGNLDSLVSCWLKLNAAPKSTSAGGASAEQADSAAALQDLVEKVMVLRQSREHMACAAAAAASNSDHGGVSKLNAKLVQYAKLLADQGCFISAYNYINDSNDVTTTCFELCEPLFVATT